MSVDTEIERDEALDLPPRATDLAVIEGSFRQLAAITRAPDDILADGRKVATALNGVLAAKPDKVMMGGEQYLEFEDWSLIATFYGKAVSTPEKECHYVDLGVIEVEPGKAVRVHGFSATAHLIDTRTGAKIAEASMTCLTDEPKWRSKSKFTWVDDNEQAIAGREVEKRGVFDGRKRARVKTGEEYVPLFQLRSMAQTRAGSKVCRLNYSWIAVLAGFKPTPAEEVDGRGPEMPLDPVDKEDLTKIAEAWKAIGEAKNKEDAEKIKGGPASKKRNDVIALLRGMGYRGTAIKDLWADFASKGKHDLEAIKVALGLAEAVVFEGDKAEEEPLGVEALFDDEAQATQPAPDAEGKV